MSGDQLDCHDGHGWIHRWTDKDGYREECVAGLSFGQHYCMVAWWGGPISDTALAHEFLHSWHTRVGIYDPQHEHPDWQPGGPLSRANALLRARGH